MPKVTGIGGLFFRSKDHQGLSRWYHDHLGVGSADQGHPWRQEAGPTVFSPFSHDTEYFGRPEQDFMLNFRVDDLKGLLAELEAKGIKTVKPFEHWDGIGDFAWIEDPEGNRIELWQAVEIKA